MAAGGDALAYSAPSGETVIVKDIRLYASGAAVSRAILYIASGALNISIVDRALASGEVFHELPWVVLLPGDDLRVASAGATTAYWISGAELEGLAN